MRKKSTDMRILPWIFWILIIVSHKTRDIQDLFSFAACHSHFSAKRAEAST